MKEPSICAIATPIGIGSVSIIRLSGEDALNIAKKIFTPFKNAVLENSVLTYGKLSVDGASDKCYAVYFKAPNTFTGEDIVEFQTHGSPLLCEKVLKSLITNGARLAKNGEFSRRAFLNGKMSLSGVEGLTDLIYANSDSAIKCAYSLFSEKLADEIKNNQDILTNILTYVEAIFDYPDDEIPAFDKEETLRKLQHIKNSLENVLNTYNIGRLYKNGVIVGILGKPNVGKSSLLNALTGQNKAIVTDIAGTTRDIIEGEFLYNGVLFRLYDTAGIRNTSNVVEKIGVDRAFGVIENADIILFVVDGSEELDDFDSAILEKIKDKNVIGIINKCDKKTVIKKIPFLSSVICISANEQSNISTVKETILNNTIGNNFINTESPVITNERHKESLKNALDSINATIQNIDDPADCVALSIKTAWDFLGEITGTTASETIIDNIFSKLCLGK